MPSPTKAPVKKPGLLDFAMEERTRECPVCALPEAVRLELPLAKKKRIPRETVLAYLTKIHGYTGDSEKLTAHHNGHHDSKLKELHGA